MLKQVIFSVFAVLFCTVQLAAQEEGIEFFHGTWTEAKAKAKEQNRIIFVDAYAEWCGPCKRMAATVFKDKQAGDFFNKNFVNLKIDMEKAENEEFARKFPVSAYPTLMFIDTSGKMMIRDVGAKTLETLLEFGKKALGANNKSVDYGKKYDAGERDPQFIHDYIVELNKAGKPSLKIVNEYLRGAKPEHQDITDKIIFEGVTEADSKVFDRMAEKVAQYRKIYSDERVDAKILSACEATVAKAIAYKSIELLQEAKDKYAKYTNKSASAAFTKRVDLEYFTKTKDSVGFLSLIIAQENELFKDKKYAAVETQVVEAVQAFPSDQPVLLWAEGTMKKVIKAKEDPKYYFTLIELQQKLLNFKDALKSAKRGKELAEKAKSTDLVNKFNFYIEGLQDRI
jgi:thiol-disulfide isomerase/thioredoxin